MKKRTKEKRREEEKTDCPISLCELGVHVLLAPFLKKEREEKKKKGKRKHTTPCIGKRNSITQTLDKKKGGDRRDGVGKGEEGNDEDEEDKKKRKRKKRKKKR